MLVEEDKYLIMVDLAREENLSVGELIRRTMEEKLNKAKIREMEKRKKAWDGIMEWRRKMRARNKSKKPLTVREIKELIDYGRRY